MSFFKIIFVYRGMFLGFLLGSCLSMLMGVSASTALGAGGICWFGWMIYLGISGDLPAPKVEELAPTSNSVPEGTYAFLEIHAPEGQETLFAGEFSLVKDKETGRTILVSHISPKDGVRIVPLDPEAEDTRELISRVAAHVVNDMV